jgi:hypothetical protein
MQNDIFRIIYFGRDGGIFRRHCEPALGAMSEAVQFLTVIPGCAHLGADPESRQEYRVAGFRVRAEEARPGMTKTTS